MVQTRSMVKKMEIEHSENEVFRKNFSTYFHINFELNLSLNKNEKVESLFNIFNFILNNINHFNLPINKIYYERLRPIIIIKLNELIDILENIPSLSIYEIILLDLLKNPIFYELIK